MAEGGVTIPADKKIAAASGDRGGDMHGRHDGPLAGWVGINHSQFVRGDRRAGARTDAAAVRTAVVDRRRAGGGGRSREIFGPQSAAGAVRSWIGAAAF